MGRHLASPFPLLMVRTSHPREQPERKDAIRIGTPLPVAPTPPRLSREKTLNCERQVQVRARRGALQCPLTADMGPNETMQRDQELDLHSFGQTEYRVRFHLRHSVPRFAYRAFPTTPSRSTFPENPRPSRSPPFFTPLSYRSQQTAPLPCKLAVLASRTTCDRQGRRSRCCASVLALGASKMSFTPSLIMFATSATTYTNVRHVWSAITV
jgi:hypothetical protein